MSDNKKNKFLNIKTEDGFDSKLEKKIYEILKEYQDQGFIISIERQKVMTLISATDEPPYLYNSIYHVAVVKPKKFRDMTYIADFVVNHINGKSFIIDVKGFKTPVFRQKEKIAALVAGFYINEINKNSIITVNCNELKIINPAPRKKRKISNESE